MPSPEELGALADRHAAALVLFARQWCAAAEDVVQEAFLKLAAQRQGPANPAAWLYAVVRNQALGQGRKEARRRRYERHAGTQAWTWFAPSPESGLVAAEVTAALADLPRPAREIIISHLWGGLTFAEIAQVVGASSSTAHRHYQEGLAALRQKLEQPCRRNRP
jgi:RNA polymerase sigma factor (sigma-70 family)